MNEIYLRFDKMIVGLAGYDYGKTVYEEQVSNKIDFSKKIIIVFPESDTKNCILVYTRLF